MPTATGSDLVVYNDLAQTAFFERRQDNLEVLSVASNGAIVLDNELIKGDFRKRTFHKVGGSIEPRNVNSTGPVTGRKIGAGKSASVKVPWEYDPYETTEGMFKCRGRDVSEFSEAVGVDVADIALEDYIKYASQGLVAAIDANADMTVFVDIATDGKEALIRGLRKYGDKFNRVAPFVICSTTYSDIVDQTIDNRIYGEAGVVVYGGQLDTLGKLVLATGAIPADAILGLVADAVSVTEPQAPGFHSCDTDDQEDLAIDYRAKGTVNTELLGYSWGETKGADPDLTRIGTDADRKEHFISDKSAAGVLIKPEAPTGE